MDYISLCEPHFLIPVVSLLILLTAVFAISPFVLTALSIHTFYSITDLAFCVDLDCSA
jgi:hypothetical protein